MLSIKAISSTAAASHYYSESDYYAKDGERDISSRWQGAAAKILGLEGEVDSQSFRELLDGKLTDGTRIGRRNGNGETEHKKGWDFTLSAPKSVSILALAGGDKRLIAAHNEAVSTALKHLEDNYSMTRQQVKGQIKDVLTKNLVVASFTHTTSRAMDPQLHTHNVIMNLTQRPDGEWRSLESRRMYEVSTKIGQVYRNELAAKVKAIGYELQSDPSKGTFEIISVPGSVRDGFSKRRKAILAAAKKYGYRTAKGMDDAAVRSREAKHHTNHEALLQSWSEQLKALDFRPEHAIATAIQRVHAGDIEKASSEFDGADLEFAYRHLAEREAVFTRDQLQAQMLRVGMGSATIDSVEAAIAKLVRAGTLLDAHLGNGRMQRAAYTTPAALAKEKYIISLMRRGKREMPRIAGRSAISALVEDKGFSKGQAAAVRLLLSSKDRVVGVQGYAGTGKTYMLTAVREVAEAQGYRLTGLSPTSAAANLLEQEAGIKSRTLASHLMTLNNTKKLTQDDQEILIVDESSLQNTQDAADLLTFSRKTRSRVFLIGDRQQLGAIEAGKPFDQLLRAGMRYTEMKEIMRQKDSPALKSAVEAAMHGKPSIALARIAKTVNEVKQPEERMQQIAERVLALSEWERQRTLILIPDNKTRSEINNLIRNGLQTKGIVAADAFAETALTNRGLSRAEKGRAKFYRKGDVVIFGRNVQSLKTLADTPYTVLNADNDFVTLQSEGGRKFDWNPARIAGRAKNGVEVYQRDKRSLAVGDVIRWRRNNKYLGLNNADVGTVRQIDAGTGRVMIDFRRAGSKTIDLRKNRHWEHGYATTVYAGQGATYDNAIVNAESFRHNLINQKSFYVALSRAKFDTHIYTDDISELAKRIGQRPGDKTSAIEGKKLNYARLLDENRLDKEVNKPLIQRIVDKVKSQLQIELDM